MQEREVELKVTETESSPSPNVINVLELPQKETEKRLGWMRGWIRYTLVIIAFLNPIIVLSAWYFSLAITGNSIHTAVSDTVGTPGFVKTFNIIIVVPICFLSSFVFLIRNVQIRVIFDRFPAYNIKSKENENEIELTDYICPCCCHCRSDGCGGPIYHNKRRNGNCVRNCKYYATTFRGINFITATTNVIAWTACVAIFVFDVYTATIVHYTVTGITMVTFLFYEFTHSITLYKQRQNEAKLSNKSCKDMCYYLDVIVSFFVPIFTVIMFLAHVISAQFIFVFDATADYVFEWIAMTAMIMYLMIFSYLFAYDDVSDELEAYVNTLDNLVQLQIGEIVVD